MSISKKSKRNSEYLETTKMKVGRQSSIGLRHRSQNIIENLTENKKIGIQRVSRLEEIMKTAWWTSNDSHGMETECDNANMAKKSTYGVTRCSCIDQLEIAKTDCTSDSVHQTGPHLGFGQRGTITRSSLNIKEEEQSQILNNMECPREEIPEARVDLDVKQTRRKRNIQTRTECTIDNNKHLGFGSADRTTISTLNRKEIEEGTGVQIPEDKVEIMKETTSSNQKLQTRSSNRTKVNKGKVTRHFTCCRNDIVAHEEKPEVKNNRKGRKITIEGDAPLGRPGGTEGVSEPNESNNKLYDPNDGSNRWERIRGQQGVSIKQMFTFENMVHCYVRIETKCLLSEQSALENKLFTVIDGSGLVRFGIGDQNIKVGHLMKVFSGSHYEIRNRGLKKPLILQYASKIPFHI